MPSPAHPARTVFFAVVAATAIGGVILWNAGGERTPTAVFGTLLMVMDDSVISLCLHEFAHAVTAFGSAIAVPNCAAT